MGHRDPQSIVPRDDKDDLLLAIYDVLVEIRNALVPSSAAESAPAAAPATADVSDEQASEAGSVLSTHGHEMAEAAAKKPAAKKTSTSTRKKPKA